MGAEPPAARQLALLQGLPCTQLPPLAVLVPHRHCSPRNLLPPAACSVVELAFVHGEWQPARLQPVYPVPTGPALPPQGSGMASASAELPSRAASSKPTSSNPSLSHAVVGTQEAAVPHARWKDESVESVAMEALEVVKPR